MVGKAQIHIVIIVEGDTDKVFFDALLKYYRERSQIALNSCEVCNIKGVTRYTSKLISKLKNEICPRAKKKGLLLNTVCCSYDTDIFEFSEKPAVDWPRVKREVHNLGIKNFCEIKVQHMIEDWFLEDINGLCQFLKIDVPPNLMGKSAFEKMQNLFKKGNKVYLKGNSCQKFISYLDLHLIRERRKTEFRKLEGLLGVRLKA